MNNVDFETWQYLVDHVVKAKFFWAYSRSNSVEFSNEMPRLLDRDDLVQEGRLALVEAWDSYRHDNEAGAKFITYAHHCIYWKVYRYIYANKTPISMRGWQADYKQETAEAKQRLSVALACRLFSEKPSKLTAPDDEDYGNTIADPYSLPSWVDTQDFEDHCMEKISYHLRPYEVEALLHRMDGKSYSQIGQFLECSRETARKSVCELFRKVRHILTREVNYEF